MSSHTATTASRPPLLPGLLFCAVLAGVAFLLSRLPGLGLLGPLGLALVFGLVGGAFLRARGLGPGASYAAKRLLPLGIVLLGVRLNFALIVGAGPAVLALDALIVILGVAGINQLGKALGLSRSLRLAIALGSSICGSSAIAAAAPVVGADRNEVSVAVGVASLYGLLGLVGYVTLTQVLPLNDHYYGLLTGATLYDVGQVLAAGAARGPAALDMATITKFTRVALLAPALLVVGTVLARRDAGSSLRASGTSLIPSFLLGFLLVGAINSLGLIPSAVRGPAETASHIVMAVAMVGIGFGVDLRAVRSVGPRALVLGAAGFLLLTLIASGFTGLLMDVLHLS